MGHVRNYTIGDVFSRYKALRGYGVLHPMGFDAFGQPAENAAIKNNTKPDIWTRRCISEMERELQRMGFSYDWDREISTCDPGYYRWNQWIFLKMLEKGLAYKKASSVNWCPSCATTLANEEVIDGGCWRCHSPVEQKELEQWYLRITEYKERLLEDLKQLTHWPERVIAMQTNWIGRSRGLEIFSKCGTAAQTFRFLPPGPIPSLAQPMWYWLLNIRLWKGSSKAGLRKRGARLHCENSPAKPFKPRGGRCKKRRRIYRRLCNQPCQWRGHTDLDCRLCLDGIRHRRNHGSAHP